MTSDPEHDGSVACIFTCFCLFIYLFYFISFAQKNTENNTINKNVTIH